jgi:hypothetical protein
VKKPKPAIEYPSVTTVLGRALPNPGIEWMRRSQPAMLESYADAGRRFHAITAYYDTHWKKCEDSPTWAGMLASAEDLLAPILTYLDWFNAEVEQVLWSEKELRSDAYRFMGHPDLIYIPRGSRVPMVLDKKLRSSLSPEIALQTAAYGLMARECKVVDKHFTRGALQITREGKIRPMVPYREEGDEAQFLYLLATYRWMVAHNVNNPKGANHAEPDSI